MNGFITALALLFYEFFKTGLLSIGGGLSAVPFLYAIADNYGWFTRERLADIIAIAESTPGPIGINAATFAGYNTAGVIGGIIATFAMALPSFIIIMSVAGTLKKFHENRYVKSVFSAIRPVTVGMIASAAMSLVGAALVSSQSFRLSVEWFNMINVYAAIFVAVFVFFIIRFKKHPIIYIGAGAALGILAGYSGLIRI